MFAINSPGSPILSPRLVAPIHKVCISQRHLKVSLCPHQRVIGPQRCWYSGREAVVKDSLSLFSWHCEDLFSSHRGAFTFLPRWECSSSPSLLWDPAVFVLNLVLLLCREVKRLARPSSLQGWGWQGSWCCEPSSLAGRHPASSWDKRQQWLVTWLSLFKAPPPPFFDKNSLCIKHGRWQSLLSTANQGREASVWCVGFGKSHKFSSGWSPVTSCSGFLLCAQTFTLCDGLVGCLFLKKEPQIMNSQVGSLLWWRCRSRSGCPRGHS